MGCEPGARSIICALLHSQQSGKPERELPSPFVYFWSGGFTSRHLPPTPCVCSRRQSTASRSVFLLSLRFGWCPGLQLTQNNQWAERAYSFPQNEVCVLIMGNTYWASKRAHWAKVLTTKPEDRSSIPGPTTQKLVSDLGRNAVYERELHGGACEWRTEKLVISFHLGGPRDGAQVHHLPISPALRYQLLK